ncbi:MAG: hypothetical protein E7335_00210 [Clostridiales bacterium]|nr:hypothetical protein [Clostridiales bacterium]
MDKMTQKRAQAVAGGLIKALRGALKDPKQLYRYHVTERTDKGTETVEKTFAKLDTKAAKDMTSMLRELLDMLGVESTGETGGIILLPAEEKEGEENGSI